MSQTDVKNLKAGFDAYNDGDFERLLELWEEDVEIDGLLVGKSLRGKVEARSWLVPEAIDQRGEPIEFRDLGGRVLVPCDWHIHGRGSGVDVDTRLYFSSRCERARWPAWKPLATSKQPSKPPGCASSGLIYLTP
jgi:hypothetical protein